MANFKKSAPMISRLNPYFPIFGMLVDQSTLLIEYLREQYAQARQHETRQTNTTTFLTAVSGALLGVGFHDGNLHKGLWWIGVSIFLVGASNWWINRAHFIGNRFHVILAGATRIALETAISVWTVPKPSKIRGDCLQEFGLVGPNASIGEKTYRALNLVPLGVMLLGIVVTLIAIHS